MNIMRYVEERNRMCQSYGNCKGCPAFNDSENNKTSCKVSIASTLDVAERVAMVEKWSAAHPRKTRQDVFLEQYPEANLGEHGVLNVCPLCVSAAYRDSNGLCGCQEKLCSDCRREFWMAEVKEDK